MLAFVALTIAGAQRAAARELEPIAIRHPYPGAGHARDRRAGDRAGVGAPIARPDDADVVAGLLPRRRLRGERTRVERGRRSTASRSSSRR